MTTVGLVGTGRMGTAMARALARAGHPLVLYNRTRDRAAALASELAATVAATPAELAAAVDISLSMVADDDAVADVYGGPEGLIAGARRGAVLVDLSTVTPRALRAFVADATAAGLGLLDSPVSGSVAFAESGQLTLMVGGRTDDLERARPVLEPLARTILHIGPLGTGAAMKLAVNAIIFGLSNAVSEALVLAERAGIDRTVAYDVIAASAVGAPFVGYKRAAFLEPERTPTAFALSLAEKDLQLITALADELGVSVAQARTNLQIIRDAAASGGPDDDFAAVAVDIRERAGRAVAATARGGER
jgi:3-hydroxyisobutyrate dehydrogenase-like beta-hydroxyacid dehydrogenase